MSLVCLKHAEQDRNKHEKYKKEGKRKEETGGNLWPVGWLVGGVENRGEGRGEDGEKP